MSVWVGPRSVTFLYQLPMSFRFDAEAAAEHSDKLQGVRPLAHADLVSFIDEMDSPLRLDRHHVPESLLG
jgi:hypothetical protein